MSSSDMPPIDSSSAAAGAGAGDGAAELSVEAGFLALLAPLANDLNILEASRFNVAGFVAVFFFVASVFFSGTGVAFAELGSDSFEALVACFSRAGAGFALAGASSLFDVEGKGGGRFCVLLFTLGFCIVPYCFHACSGSSEAHSTAIFRLHSVKVLRSLNPPAAKLYTCMPVIFSNVVFACDKCSSFTSRTDRTGVGSASSSGA